MIMKCKSMQIYLKLIIKNEDSLSKINSLFKKFKSLSYHIKILEFVHINPKFFNRDDAVFKIFTSIKYLVNIDKITGYFRIKDYSKLKQIIQLYSHDTRLFRKIPNIMTNKLCFTLNVNDSDLISFNPQQRNILSFEFSSILPILTIIPLINLELSLKSFTNKTVSFPDLHLLKYSLRELTLIMTNNHLDLNELQILNCLHSLKHLILTITSFDLWKFNDKTKLAGIIHGLSIISLEIKIIVSNLSERVLRIFPDNLLIEISYLDYLEDLVLCLYGDIQFNSKNIYDELLNNSIYKHYYNKKIQFAKLKTLNIRFLSNVDIVMAMNSIVYNNGINLNNISLFKLQEGLKYILTNNDNIMFKNNMNKLKHLSLIDSYSIMFLDDILLKDMDYFFNCIYSLNNLEYLQITNMINVNVDIFKRSLMILNHLYKLKVFILEWLDIIVGNDDINENWFVQWLQGNLKCNDFLRELKLTIIPIENQDILSKAINIIKRKYKDLSKLSLKLGNTNYNDSLLGCVQNGTAFGYFFNELYIH